MRPFRPFFVAALLSGCATTAGILDVGASLRAQIDADYLTVTEAADAVSDGLCRSLRSVGIRSVQRSGGDQLAFAADFVEQNLASLRGNAYTVQDVTWSRTQSGRALTFRTNILYCRQRLEFAARSDRVAADSV